MVEGARLDALQRLDVLDTEPETAFDDIVALASQLCNTPVALVSLVDHDRQWFKARVGFPSCETDLDRSVCRFVVDERATIIIPDLTADPRTRDNPLVTDDPAIRFYAGAPLATHDGHVLGALCVIDQKPRPEGLTPEQQRTLSALARRTVEALEVRRLERERQTAVADQERAEAARASEDERWERMFETRNDGLILGQVVRDEAGRVADWRYERVNEVFTRLVGLPADQVLGRTIREILPDVEEEWITDFGQAVDGGEPVHFRRQVGTLGRWYDGVVQVAGPDRFTALFQEVTDLLAANARQEGLLHLGDLLRDLTDVDAMVAGAASIIGRTLGASRCAYGELFQGYECVRFAPGWMLPGLPAIEGEYRFNDFGHIQKIIVSGRPLAITDALTDPRTADEADKWAALAIRGCVNVAVLDRGRPVGVLLVHWSQPHEASEAELAFLRNAADRLEIGIARQRAEDTQAILNGEIAHRLKNSLSMVQSIANQTFKGVVDRATLNAFARRLTALGTAHDALLHQALRSADLRFLLDKVLSDAGIAGRYTAEGPKVELGPRAALSTSLLLHELATNAMKYGALSTSGTIRIGWSIKGEGDDAELTLHWTEIGGPPVTAPTRRGFGSRLVSLGLVGAGGSSLDYGPEGFKAIFQATIAEVRRS
ncbi:GAF domain-containing protein [Sphingomonas sp. BK235]|uniref:GAF domain-containing protein n=1 Tax=Sphingomonas sp. BK235 TaxID=2512131 RepID=UPI00104BC2F9|nr:GAF domain-containing protein [Sphingomonas sp. BK235]TCP30070.1 two-component sensor histidine kinase [Sphingomonas sp. BK235]